MRFIIYGAGAIGGTLGSRLFVAGYEVLFIARGQHGSTIVQDGLTYRNPHETLVQKIPSVPHPSAIAFRSDDVMILTVKSQDTVTALSDLAAVAPRNLPIFCAQNGVCNESLALRFFPRVYAMLVLCPGTYLTPGEVIHSARDPGGCFDTGCYPNGSDSTAQAVAGALEQSHFAANADPKVMRLKYAKLLLNLGNPLQLILKDFNHSREIMRFLRQEALSCFEAAGIDCANQSESEARFGLVKPETVANAPRGGSSTWQSVARGQTQIETPYLNGEICLIGRENNLATPANDRIATLALKATNQADFRQQASSTLLEEIERNS